MLFYLGFWNNTLSVLLLPLWLLLLCLFSWILFQITPSKHRCLAGLVLDPLFFSLYTTSFDDLISSYGLRISMLMILLPILSKLSADLQSHIFKCLLDISNRMSSGHVKLNMSKMELVIFSPKPSLPPTSPITAEDNTILPQTWNLSVTFYSPPSLTPHNQSVAKACGFHLCNIPWICLLLSSDTAPTMVQTLITTCLDYCNGLLPQASLLSNSSSKISHQSDFPKTQVWPHHSSSQQTPVPPATNTKSSV